MRTYRDSFQYRLAEAFDSDPSYGVGESLFPGTNLNKMIEDFFGYCRTIVAFEVAQFESVILFMTTDEHFIAFDRTHLLSDPHASESDVDDSIWGAGVWATGNINHHFFLDALIFGFADDAGKKVMELSGGRHSFRAVRGADARNDVLDSMKT